MKPSPRPRSDQAFERAQRLIPGGMVSLNRKVDPSIAFVRGPQDVLIEILDRDVA